MIIFDLPLGNTQYTWYHYMCRPEGTQMSMRKSSWGVFAFIADQLFAPQAADSFVSPVVNWSKELNIRKPNTARFRRKRTYLCAVTRGVCSIVLLTPRGGRKILHSDFIKSAARAFFVCRRAGPFGRSGWVRFGSLWKMDAPCGIEQTAAPNA